MTTLLLSILSSSVILVIFKLYKKYGVDTFQAIIVNYFTAGTLGIVFFHDGWTTAAGNDLSWLTYVILVSFLFISLFFVMARSSQENGVASTSIAVKMGMAIPLILMMTLYAETPSVLKLLGIILAVAGVYLVSSNPKSSNVGPYVWMLAVLFVGSGLLDFILNYVQKFVLTDLSLPLFSAFALGTGGIIGLLVFLVLSIGKRPKITFKNIFAGIILGIPNFYSIYFLLLSYRTTGWSDSTVLAITNVSIVLMSAFFGFVFFKESKTNRKLVGLATAILAIVTLYFAN